MLDALAVSGDDWAWLAIVGWAGFQVLYTLRNPGGFSMRVSRLRRFDRRLPLPSA